jgi:hypothetical protein
MHKNLSESRGRKNLEGREKGKAGGRKEGKP